MALANGRFEDYHHIVIQASIDSADSSNFLESPQSGPIAQASVPLCRPITLSSPNRLPPACCPTWVPLQSGNVLVRTTQWVFTVFHHSLPSHKTQSRMSELPTKTTTFFRVVHQFAVTRGTAHSHFDEN